MKPWRAELLAAPVCSWLMCDAGASGAGWQGLADRGHAPGRSLLHPKVSCPACGARVCARYGCCRAFAALAGTAADADPVWSMCGGRGPRLGKVHVIHVCCSRDTRWET
eukprot:1722916-Rhodomonas_salina.3